jgi:hypothetical protein
MYRTYHTVYVREYLPYDTVSSHAGVSRMFTNNEITLSSDFKTSIAVSFVAQSPTWRLLRLWCLA